MRNSHAPHSILHRFRSFHPDHLRRTRAVGSEETDSLVGHSEAVAGIRNAGGRAEFMVVEQGTHGGMIVPAMPVVLDFFAEIAAEAKGSE